MPRHTGSSLEGARKVSLTHGQIPFEKAGNHEEVQRCSISINADAINRLPSSKLKVPSQRTNQSVRSSTDSIYPDTIDRLQQPSVLSAKVKLTLVFPSARRLYNDISGSFPSQYRKWGKLNCSPVIRLNVMPAHSSCTLHPATPFIPSMARSLLRRIPGLLGVIPNHHLRLRTPWVGEFVRWVRFQRFRMRLLVSFAAGTGAGAFVVAAGAGAVVIVVAAHCNCDLGWVMRMRLWLVG